MTDTGTVIDTPEGIYMYRLMSMRSMLGLEIKTGLRHSRGSVLAATNKFLADVGAAPPKSYARKQPAHDRLDEYIDGAMRCLSDDLYPQCTECEGSSDSLMFNICPSCHMRLGDPFPSNTRPEEGSHQ